MSRTAEGLIIVSAVFLLVFTFQTHLHRMPLTVKASMYEQRKEVYLSTLIAQRLNIDAVHSITSMVIRPSHISMFKDQTPPWNCTHINKHKNTQTLSQKKLTANIPNPLVLVPQTFLHEAWLCPLTSSASTVGVNFQTDFLIQWLYVDKALVWRLTGCDHWHR